MKASVLMLLVALAVFASACVNQTILNDGKTPETTPTEVPTPKTYEADLRAAKTAGYNFIYVVRRKDGGQIDYHDKLLLSSHTGKAQRRAASEDGKAYTIASNDPLPEADINALHQRFLISILKDSPGLANSNQNSAANDAK
ncbi:MAG: hypothetical protein DYH05_05605 [Acidobacteria bacterium ACB1]|nr:hypothetical protein [Pyrinomonadaceae bacterium]MCE7961959.1 hypothetical protein [Acidobacteria bacterium ACB1]RIJ94440.1 MAG: hypothetical protein DCC44_04610 [Acidobacteriota bacterium]